MQTPEHNNIYDDIPVTPGRNIENIIAECLSQPEDIPSIRQEMEALIKEYPDATSSVDILRRRLEYLSLKEQKLFPETIVIDDDEEEQLSSAPNVPPAVADLESATPQLIPTPRPSPRVQVLEDIEIVPESTSHSSAKDLHIIIKDDNKPGEFEKIVVSWEALNKSKKRKQRFNTRSGIRVNVKLLATGQIKVVTK